mmetsp:Transcript_14095/g.23327  ORF Transcript_14095/g.23327 Transcript_14095/m.23327 type:complete len:179 (-) Transcript_14095:155-691(-)
MRRQYLAPMLGSVAVIGPYRPYSILALALFPVSVLALLTLRIRFGVRSFVNSVLDREDLSKALFQETYLDSKVNRFWVAVKDDSIAGCVALLGHKDPGTVELKRMSVDRRFRRQGIAGKLLEALIQHCRTEQINEITLTTSSLQPDAQRLYERYGFKLIEKQRYTAFMYLKRYALRLQ